MNLEGEPKNDVQGGFQQRNGRDDGAGRYENSLPPEIIKLTQRNKHNIGSTNAVLHLLAMAKSCGARLSLSLFFFCSILSI